MTAPTPPPADSRDARVEKLLDLQQSKFGPALSAGVIALRTAKATNEIDRMEAAGLLVLLPDDATRERMAFGIFGGSERSWAASLNHPSPNERDHAFDAADRVLAALAERPSGGAG